MILVFNLLLPNNPFQSLGMDGAKKKKKKSLGMDTTCTHDSFVFGRM